MKSIDKFKDFFKKNEYEYVSIENDVLRFIQQSLLEDYPDIEERQVSTRDQRVLRGYIIEYIKKNCMLKGVILPAEQGIIPQREFTLTRVAPAKGYNGIVHFHDSTGYRYFSSINGASKLRVKKKINRIISPNDPYGEENWG